MTAVTLRPPEAAAAPVYRRTLKSGIVSISLANGVIAGWAMLVLVTTSTSLGVIGLALACVIGFLDARFTTPTRLDVSADGVELGYWKRTKRFDAKAVVLTHDVPRDRFVLSRRGHRRPLVRFRDDDAFAAQPFMAAGVEIISH